MKSCKGKILYASLSVVLAAVGVCGDGVAAETVRLAEDGKAKAKIVVAAKADKAARFAAQELQGHLELITGAKYEIIELSNNRIIETGNGWVPILVGESALTKHKGKEFQKQQFLVDVRADGIELIGLDKEDKGAFTLSVDPAKGVSGKGWPGIYDAQGTMYAVYDFLERDLGVKWVDPTDTGTWIEKRPTLEVKVGTRRGEPFILSRTKSGRPGYGSPLLWSEKRDKDKVAAFTAVAYANPKSAWAAGNLFLLRHRFGGERRFANHSFNGWANRFLNDGVHSAKRAKEFEAYHPEYFAKGYPGYPQLCYSNPATIAQVVKDVRAYFDGPEEKRRWGVDSYCLEPNDNNSFCKCEACVRQAEPERAKELGSHSTYWFRFVNAVAREIAKSHPGRKISTLCYHDHEALPSGFKLEPNVIVWFCLSDNRRPYTQRYEHQLGRMREWRAAYPDQPMAMWLYNTFPLETAGSGNFRCFPGAFAHVAESQYRFFKELNVRHGLFHCGFNGEVDNYLQLEWMIDPDRRADELLDEFFRPCGKAGQYLKDYYLLCERRYCDKSLYSKADWRQTADLAWDKLGDDATMAKLGELMEAAERAAETPVEKTRVKMWRLGIWDYMKPAADAFRVRRATPVPEWTAKRIPDAGGDWARVKGEAMTAADCPLYSANSALVAKDVPAHIRLGHDGKFLYLELGMDCTVSNLVNSSGIMSHDCWEILIARQRGVPYRYYFSAPDGRMGATSTGEVNWRANVAASESGHPTFKATCTAANTADRWVSRYVFPLEEVCTGGIRPGENLYLNAVAVLSRTTVPDPEVPGRYAIVSFASHTSVHTSDRTCVITLEK